MRKEVREGKKSTEKVNSEVENNWTKRKKRTKGKRTTNSNRRKKRKKERE
jgi:hypothetical protein